MKEELIFQNSKIFDFCMKVKKEHHDRFKESYVESYDGVPCIVRWINDLDDSMYKDIIKLLIIKQKGNLVIISYEKLYNIFNLSDYESYFNLYDGLYRHCRGIVIDMCNEIIVCRPFDKFFNLGEVYCPTEKIMGMVKDGVPYCISNKLDGSMISARYIDMYDDIVVASSASIDEEKCSQLKNAKKIIYNSDKYKNMLKNNPDYTYIFEYISAEDAHVVYYTEEQNGLYLIGCRNTYTGEQKSYRYVLDEAKKYSIPSTVIYDKTIEEILEHDVKEKKGYEQEGFVLSIGDIMVKIKTEDYLAIKKVSESVMSPKSVIKAIADGTFDDMISVLPEVKIEKCKRVLKSVVKYVNCMEDEVNRLYEEAPKNSRKDFMIWVNNNVSKKYCKYLKLKYDNKDYSFLKTNNGRYVEPKDIGIEENIQF